ncbi:MAG: ferritin-like domain-containing protein [Actinobacteria bacterium]|nr:MAG: ferritin-like domain-containing protein [Actinomycetota bacterium]
MSTFDVALEGPKDWEIDTSATTVFDFDYKGGRDQLLRLYDKGTRRQWIGSDRLDWSLDVDPEGPVGMPDELHPLFGTPWWDKMNDKERVEARRHLEAWRFSQFMHGEQGALICTAKIVQTVPNVDSKFYAATQVIDEARHVEVYSRYLYDKVQLVYPLNKNLESLLNDVIEDSRWDMTYLGMQVLIEGLALAAFGLIRNAATEPLAKALNAYVMQDEARHVMFGRIALRDYYPQLTQKERDDREEFCVDACYRMRDRFLGEEVWERLGLPQEAADYVEHSELLRSFRNYLFTRIVPIIKDIGLWGPKITKAFTDMGVIEYAQSDLDGEMANDEKAAEDIDKLRRAEGPGRTRPSAGRGGRRRTWRSRPGDPADESWPWPSRPRRR